MKDSEFAAQIRMLFGKETNTEALAVIRGGAQTIQAAQIEADAAAVKAKLRTIRDKVSGYFRERWAEITGADDAVVVVDDAFDLDDDDETATGEPATPLAAPEVVRNEADEPQS